MPEEPAPRGRLAAVSGERAQLARAAYGLQAVANDGAPRRVPAPFAATEPQGTVQSRLWNLVGAHRKRGADYRVTLQVTAR